MPAKSTQNGVIKFILFNTGMTHMHYWKTANTLIQNKIANVSRIYIIKPGRLS